MLSQVAPNPSPQQRVIRVFVSSTFRDMQAERNELVKRTFPQLRKLSESRGVTWGEVDLRWGITDEQKAEGKVLPICLEEIRAMLGRGDNVFSRRRAKGTDKEKQLRQDLLPLHKSFGKPDDTGLPIATTSAWAS